MRARLFAFTILFLATLCAPADAGQRYILRARSDKAHNVADRHHLSVVREFSVASDRILLVEDNSGRSGSEIVPRLKSDSEVGNFELNGAVAVPELNQSTVGILDGITDPSTVSYYGATVWSEYVSQPLVNIVSIQAAQNSFAHGGGTVAIIDTGVDPNQPVLKASLVPGYDFLTNTAGSGSELADLSPTQLSAISGASSSMTDKQAVQVNQSTVAILDQSTVGILDGSLPAAFGHGTMVAGLVHLTAPGARIMPLRAFESSGTGDLYNVLNAIYYAVNHGAKTINMSFSMTQASDELVSAVGYANSNRVVCVASVGNSGQQTMTYPAGLKKVLGTASTSDTDVRSSFSNYGLGLVKLAAPGERLTTTFPGNNYARVWGTSFSAAVVSGGAGLLREIDSNISQDQATLSLSQAVNLGSDLGAGRIDLYRACQYWATQKGK